MTVYLDTILRNRAFIHVTTASMCRKLFHFPCRVSRCSDRRTLPKISRDPPKLPPHRGSRHGLVERDPSLLSTRSGCNHEAPHRAITLQFRIQMKITTMYLPMTRTVALYPWSQISCLLKVLNGQSSLYLCPRENLITNPTPERAHGFKKSCKSGGVKRRQSTTTFERTPGLRLTSTLYSTLEVILGYLVRKIIHLQYLRNCKNGGTNDRLMPRVALPRAHITVHIAVVFDHHLILTLATLRRHSV